MEGFSRCILDHLFLFSDSITEACGLGFLFTFFVVTMNPKLFVGVFQLSSIHCNIYLPMTSWLCFPVRKIYFPFYSGFKGLYDCSV